MKEIQETQLPGVGIRHDFVTEGDDRVGVILHHSGQRDLLIYDHEDPDTCRVAVRLQKDEAHIMSELLGAVHVTQSVANVQQMIKGLAIDWIPISETWTCAGSSIAEMMVRSRTGVSIVAVIRGDHTFPSPEPEFRFRPGDLAVVVGTPDGIRKAYDLLHGT